LPSLAQHTVRVELVVPRPKLPWRIFSLDANANRKVGIVFVVSLTCLVWLIPAEAPPGPVVALALRVEAWSLHTADVIRPQRNIWGLKERLKAVLIHVRPPLKRTRKQVFG